VQEGVAEVREVSFEEWYQANADWVDAWALFREIKRQERGAPWFRWPEPLRDGDPGALEAFREARRDRIERSLREQYLFDRRWGELRAYARSKGIALFGDLPVYVALDSADLWAHRRLFRLDSKGMPTHVAGVPPDYFSSTGQLWGNPLYAWEKHREEGYRWWRRRLQVELSRFDLVRIDHFRAIDQYWEVPAGHTTARDGRWVDGPGREFLAVLVEEAGPGRLVAEDLGVIPPSVVALRREFGIPGMAVLQFAFDDPETEGNPHHPDSMAEDVVCYPGTHDNATVASWFAETEKADAPHLRRRRQRVVELMLPGEPVHRTLVRVAFESPARMAIVTVQDLLGLDDRARINTPGRKRGNWRWRLEPGQLERVDWGWLAELTERTGRAP